MVETDLGAGRRGAVAERAERVGLGGVEGVAVFAAVAEGDGWEGISGDTSPRAGPASTGGLAARVPLGLSSLTE